MTISILEAQTILSTTSFPGKTQDFYWLLNDILATPRLHTHDRMKSLLHHLENSLLAAAIDFIARAETAPLPQNVRGTFFHAPAINEQHANCRILLNNVSNPYQENDIFSLANGLLQSALLIYNNLKLEESSLNNSDSFATIAPETSLLKGNKAIDSFSGCNLF